MSTVERVMDMFDNLDLPENEIKEILRKLSDAVEDRILREQPELPTDLFKYVYRVEVLRDSPNTYFDLFEIAQAIDDGGSSGIVTLVASGELEREEMAAELIAQGSDPEFLISDWNEEGPE